MDWLAQIKAIVAEVEDTAYQRGWAACRAQIVAATASMPGAALAPHFPDPPPIPAPRERPIIDVVHDLIKASPGLRGTAIVDAMMMGNPGRDRKSMDRTTRTALMRLKKRKAIKSEGGTWYPMEAA